MDGAYTSITPTGDFFDVSTTPDKIEFRYTDGSLVSDYTVNLSEVAPSAQKAAIQSLVIGNSDDSWAHTRAPLGFPGLGTTTGGDFLGVDGPLTLIRDPKTGIYSVTLKIEVDSSSAFDAEGLRLED